MPTEKELNKMYEECKKEAREIQKGIIFKHHIDRTSFIAGIVHYSRFLKKKAKANKKVQKCNQKCM